MNKEYCNSQWWLTQIETRCKNEQKRCERYTNSDVRSRELLIISFIVVFLGIIVGLLADLQASSLIKSIGKGFETLLMFIAGIIVGFTIDEYRNKSTILEESSLLRPRKFEEIVKEIQRGGKINQSQADRCISYIENGASQMSKSGEAGLSALKNVIDNVIREMCR